MLNQELIDKIILKSISLEEFCLNDLAWTKEDALNLIHSLLEDKIGILGGDVYKLTSNHIDFPGDNWACEPRQSESEEEFNLRSKLESLKYIENYHIEDNENIIFSLTFTERF